MPQFRIPGPLRRLSEGQITVPVEATDLGSAIEALDARYPGFKDRLLDEKGELRQFVNVYLNDEDVRLGSGLKAKVAVKDESSIVPAVAGGRRRPHPVGPAPRPRRGGP
jgi:molybdopterin synthase sulfur carrier subunit